MDRVETGVSFEMPVRTSQLVFDASCIEPLENCAGIAVVRRAPQATALRGFELHEQSVRLALCQDLGYWANEGRHRTLLVAVERWSRAGKPRHPLIHATGLQSTWQTTAARFTLNG